MPTPPSATCSLLPAGSCPSPAAALLRRIHQQPAGLVAKDGPDLLASVFQPIVSLAHRRIVGHEALVRSLDAAESLQSPAVLFARERTPHGRVWLDRLCRALHLQTYHQQCTGEGWLFLNVSPDTILHGPCYGPFFADILARTGVPPHRIVVEITASSSDNEAHLAASVQYYRRLGCLVALDKFGAGHPSISRLWRLRPDIVKLDRSLIRQAGHDPVARHALPALVTLLHETGSLVLGGGVETPAEAAACLESGIDLAQGFWFGHPARIPVATAAADIWQKGVQPGSLHQGAADWGQGFRDLEPYCQALVALARQLTVGVPFETACQAFLALPQADRCYLLNAAGRQITAAMVRIGPTPRDPRFRPLEESCGADWSRQPYYSRAICFAGQVQMSRPYLSVASGRVCRTLSLAVPDATGQLQVICADTVQPDYLCGSH